MLRDAVATLRPDWNVVELAHTVEEALQAIERHAPELLLLDIHLPGSEDGRWVETLDPTLKVIFATGDPNFAIHAFERAAIDYVMKPLTMRRLKQAFDRVVTKSDPTSADATPGKEPDSGGVSGEAYDSADRTSTARDPLEWITVSRGQELLVIPAQDVIYVKADLKYTQIVSKRGSGLARMSIGEMVCRLPRGQFAQIHRGVVVNRRFIESVRRDEFGRLAVRLEGIAEPMRVSKTFQNVFRIT